MDEYLYNDPVPHDMAEETLETIEEVVAGIEKDLAVVKASVNRINGWFPSQRMVYGELTDLRDTARALYRAANLIEDAAAEAKSAANQR